MINNLDSVLLYVTFDRKKMYEFSIPEFFSPWKKKTKKKPKVIVYRLDVSKREKNLANAMGLRM